MVVQVVSAGLSKRKVAGSIPTIGNLHAVGPCKNTCAVFAFLATNDTFTATFNTVLGVHRLNVYNI